MSTVMGVIYLAVALSLSTTLVSRLYVYWQGFVWAQRILLFGVLVIMLGFTQRGIELLWFDAPPPRPAGYIAVVGAILCMIALLIPVDERLRPPTWQDTLKAQDPDNYDKFMDILNRSAANRNQQTTHAERYHQRYDSE